MALTLRLRAHTDPPPEFERPQYPIKVSSFLLWEMAGAHTTIEWGEPDEDGFYNPTVTQGECPCTDGRRHP